MSVAADIVRLIHLALVIFVVVTPFIGKHASWSVLVLHCMTVITLVVHWMTGQSACFLTMMESALRGIPTGKSFMHSIVSPVYQIEDVDLRHIVHRVTPVLGLISAFHLSTKLDQLKADLATVFRAVRVRSEF